MSRPAPSPSIATIGTFDGVHLGHRRLLEGARAMAERTGTPRVVAFVFDPHPAVKLRPDAAPPRLTSYELRRSLLLEAGADEVVRLKPGSGVLETEAEAFLGWVRQEHGAIGFVEGTDFRYGKGRAGDASTLEATGARDGFEVEIVEPIEVELLDQSVVRASSTLTRWLLQNGRVADAALVQGRPHEVSGEVVRGHRRGRTIGFPTANTAPECDETGMPLLVPADGVYAGTCELPDGRTFAAAISVGTNPTFQSAAPVRTVEPHLLDAPSTGDTIQGLDEYGWTIRVRFDRWLRDAVRFGGVDQLVEQLKRDRERARSTETTGAGA